MVGGYPWAPKAEVPVLFSGDLHLWFAPAAREEGFPLLRWLLGEYLGRPPGSFRIETSAGRLCVPGFPISCSVSDRAGAILLGFTSGRCLGVALERLRSDVPYPDRGLSDVGLARVRMLPPSQRNEAAVREWCREEAQRRAGSAAAAPVPVPELPGYAVAAAAPGPRTVYAFQFGANGLG